MELPSCGSLPAGWKEPAGPVPMDAILNCKPEDLEDYYNLLGCDELSTVEQILAEYKIKALECHPDKHPGNPKAVEDFQRLQQAKETLTNAESRARYDHWRRSRVAVPFQQWAALGGSVRTVGAAPAAALGSGRSQFRVCCTAGLWAWCRDIPALQCTGLSKVRRTKCWKLLTLVIPTPELMRCGPNRWKTVEMDYWKGAGNKKMLQSLM
ncbi:dnaJ homolog subfamily C member 12 isoform X2 [Passer montanus]|uniref:dnaJ homolog subfamily C member 12 isoform X2 n=1 Tax=Passer montanus TaxID=9160 RepID=UPI00196053A6|nr:dnaJ homolog subfamily C member 12 isoform X2 [Passer montanus]